MSNPPAPGRAAAVAALFCLAAAFFQLYLGLQSGGTPPEFVLFGGLAIIFGLLWYYVRRRRDKV